MSENRIDLLPRRRSFRDKLRVVVATGPETNRVEYISLRQAALKYGKPDRIGSYKKTLLAVGYCFVAEGVMVNV